MFNHYHVVLHVDARTAKSGVIGKCSNAGQNFSMAHYLYSSFWGQALFGDLVDAL